MSENSEIIENKDIKAINFFEDTKAEIIAQRTEFWKKSVLALTGEGGNPDEITRIIVQKELEADFDATGSLTQVGFLRRVTTEELPKLERNKSRYAVLFIDLDGLRIINNTQGHEKGTEAIVNMIQSVGESIRHGDLIGRWTKGDEFIVLLPGCTKAEVVKQRIVESFKLKGVAASVGAVDADYKDEFIDVVNHADHEMYREKNTKKVNNNINNDVNT